MVSFVLSFLFVLALVVPVREQITEADADFDGSGEVDIADFLLFGNYIQKGRT